jgi:hypothetical protein
MITLTGQRGIAGCNVYADDVDALVYYVLPQSPRIAFDDGGKPIFSLVWYRRPVDQLTEEERKNRLGGGLLTFSVELATTADQEQQIRKALAADPAVHQLLENGNPLGGPDYRNWWLNEINQDEGKLAQGVKLESLPVVDGSVTVAILGEDPDNLADFLATVIGAGRVSMTGRQRAAFMAKLTQDGAVLLWDMLERNLPAIRIGYDLKFDYRMTGVRMSVWCDAEKSYRAVQEQWAHINDNASWSVTHDDGGTHYRFSHDKSTDAGSRLQITAVDSEAAGVEIIPEAGPDLVKPELIAELTQQGNEMIKDFLAATFLEFKAGQDFKPDEEPDLDTALAEQDGKPYGHHGIEYYKLKDWSENMSATLNYQSKSLAVAEGHAAPNDNLSNILAGNKVADFRTQIELDDAWYRYLDVQVVCTADFDEDPVDLVEATLGYHASGQHGKIDEDKSLVFRKETPPQRFTTYVASPEQDQYDYSYTVFYKGSSQKMTVTGKSKETVLVLDTDRMGILRVDVQAGLVDWTQVQSLFVQMWYGTGVNRKETEFVLDSAHQSHRWVEVIAKEVTEPYGYQVTLVDKQGQRMEQPAETSRTKTLVVNQPIVDKLEVTFVPAGAFGSDGLLSQVVVAARYRDDAHDYTVDDTFTMVKQGDSKVWTVPLIDKTLRRYEYQVTVFYSDGVTREDDWQKTDHTVLPCGDPYGFRVKILPNLLKNPPGLYQFGFIHLGFDDSQATPKIHTERDFEIMDFTESIIWRFRLGDPNRHEYKYRLTLFKSDGQKVELPEAKESKEVLVLEPPAP